MRPLKLIRANKDNAVFNTSTPRLRLPVTATAQCGGAAFLVGLVLLATTSARAATDTWNGVGSDWNTGSDWTNGISHTVPGSGDTAQFSSTGNSKLNVTFASPGSVNSILFTGNTAGAYFVGTTNGPALTLSSGGSISTATSVTKTETVQRPPDHRRHRQHAGLHFYQQFDDSGGGAEHRRQRHRRQ